MKMDDLKIEKTQGLDFQYLGDVIDKKKELGKKYLTPDVKLILESRHDTEANHCEFCYVMKEENK